MGMVEFTATGGSFDKDGRITKSFLAEIELGDSTYSEKIEYIVAKPVIQIQSASVQALYRNCGNKLDIQVPALGANYNPTFQVSGGSPIGGRGGQVTIVPTAPTCEVKVYSSQNFIGSQKFRVKPIPKPDIVVKVDGKQVDERSGLAQIPRQMQIDAIPDEDFAQFLPDDARYRVTQWQVTLARGARPVDQINVSGPSTSLQQFVAKARANDRLVIEIKEVQRMNFQGERESVTVGTSAKYKNVPLNL
jgi:gliding motility-associated protein GldM